MLLVMFPVNSRLLLGKFWGSQKLYADFQLCRVVSALTPYVVQGSTISKHCIICANNQADPKQSSCAFEIVFMSLKKIYVCDVWKKMTT